MWAADRRIAVLTDYFLHSTTNDLVWTGENMTLLNLVRFLQEELGWTVDIYQISPIKERSFGRIKVHGLAAQMDPSGMQPGLNFNFAHAALAYDLRIYYHWHLAFPQVAHYSIVVSQGVFWDTPAGVINRQNQIGREEWFKRLLYAVAAPAAFVAQDRNTVNVVKTMWPGYEHRLVYLPPGVDLERFQPAAARDGSADLHVVCPQDFGYEQGLSEILALSRLAAEEGLNLHLEILGRTREYSTAFQLAERVRALPKCSYRWAPSAHLPRIFRQADAALLPYRACTGASLHCLQAMAAGLPIVAGLAGGISEMVVDGWNGFLVRPGSAAPYLRPLAELAGDPELRRRMGRNSRSLAEGYPEVAWKQRWRELLERVLAMPAHDQGRAWLPLPED